MVLTMLLIVGIGQVWGESIEINTTNSGVNGSYRDYEFDVSSITFGCTQWMKNTNIQAKKSITNSLYNVDAIPGTITSIVVKQTGTARAIKIYGGTTNKPTTQITSPSTAAEMTFNFTGKNYTYFSLTTPSNACYFDKITINYTPSGGGGSTTVDPTVTFSSGEYTVGGAALDLSTLWESNSTGAVTYSVTNAGTTGATINGTYFTATAAGTCTVQASQAKTASHNAITKTATITVNAAAGGGGGGECTWQLVTDASTLKAGDEIVIAAKDYNYAISTTQNTNNRAQASITKNNNTITFENDVQIITLYEGIEVANTFLFKVKNGYLYAASSDGNQLKTTTQPNANADWYITVAANTNVATIKASGNNTRNLIRYNSSNNPPIFSCYGSGQKDVAIYKKVCTTETTVCVIPKCGGDGGGTWLVVIEWFATF